MKALNISKGGVDCLQDLESPSQLITTAAVAREV
jgi:hypothetical protein